MAEKSLEDRCRAVGLLDRIESLVGLVEDAGDDVEKADEAEQRLIEELRKMGNEALHGWAERKVARKAEEVESAGGAKKHCKKNSGGERRTG